MSPLESLGLFLACGLIGAVSAMLGLGGGLFVVPLLILVLGLEPIEAAPISLICTLCTSAAGSVALDKAKLADLKVVVTLELAATVGAVVGAVVLSKILPPPVVLGVFTIVVTYAAWRMFSKARSTTGSDAGQQVPPYEPQRYPLGLLGCWLAGVVSGLLGIGGGPIKVPVQTEVMKIPTKVAFANSNLMVGITAAAGAAAYYADGALLVGLVGPCALGTATGAYLGGLLAPRFDTRPLTFAFSGILVVLAVSVLWKAIALVV